MQTNLMFMSHYVVPSPYLGNIGEGLFSNGFFCLKNECPIFIHANGTSVFFLCAGYIVLKQDFVISQLLMLDLQVYQ